jgi:ACS family hexuronate transporter-like MFS transporter
LKVSGVSSYRLTILLLATLVQVGVSILQQAPAALGRVLIRALDLSRAQIGVLSSAIWGVILLAMLPVGLLIERDGERKLIVAGVTAMALLVLWATQLRAFVWLLILFLLASIGAASSAPGGSKAIAAWFPSSRRGGAMGIRQTGVTIGGLAAAFLLPPVAVRFGWEAALGLGAGVTLVTVLLFALFYRELSQEVDEGAADDSYPPRVPVGSIVWDRGFLATTGYAFVLMGVQGSVASYLALSLHEEVGLSVVAAGAFLAVFQVGGIAGRIGWGVVSDKIGRRGPVMLLVGLVAMGSCLAMASVGEGTVIPLVAALAFLLGLSAMGWNGLYLTRLSESVPMHAAATAMGASLTIAFVGMFLVSPLFGLAADLTGSYGVSWLGLAGWTVVGIALGFLAREPHEGAKP